MQLDWNDRRTQLGVALVALGVLALLSNVGLFAGLSRVIGMVLFGAAGVLVIGMYRRDPGRLWTLPVGFTLLGLAVATLELPWSGGAFLGSIGLGFLSIWLLDSERNRWWALIPAGVLFTLGVVATIDQMTRASSDTSGTIFFLGLAATFAALYLLPSVQQRWAIWPALALGVIAILTMSFSGGWIAPLVLIAVGAWLLTRQSRPSDVRSVEPTPPSDPSSPTGPVTPLSPMPTPEAVPTPPEASSAESDVVRDAQGRAVAAAAGADAVEPDAVSTDATDGADDTDSEPQVDEDAATHEAHEEHEADEERRG